MRTPRALSTLGVGAFAVVAGLLLSGCGTSGDSSDYSVDSAMMAEGAMPAEAPMMDEPARTADVAVTERSIIRTAYVSMRVSDVTEAVADVRDLVARRKGIISGESLSSGTPGGYATITAQVPAADLTAFLDEVGALGDVDTLDITAQDVTTQVIDLDARIAVLESSIARLNALLAEATRVEDIIAIEAELANRQAELDSLTSQRTYLADQVAMSTVTVTMSPITEIADVDMPGFLSGLQTGWSAFLALIGFAITAAGFLVPFVVVAAIVLIPVTVWLVGRSRRRAAAAGAMKDADAAQSAEAAVAPVPPPT
jgi:hypothetical protein